MTRRSPSPAIVAGVLNLLALLSSSPSPHLTWYADDAAERVELSGKVLANWVSKAANLLEEEGVEPGATVLLDLPVHWRAAVWAMAAWLRGAYVAFDAAGPAPDVVVTYRPEQVDADVVVAVPLAPLALAWAGELPAGVVDGAADLMAQADQLMSREAVAPDALAAEDLTFADLLTPVGRARRAALVPQDNAWVVDAMRLWDAGGSVVVFRDVPPDRVTSLSAQEGAQA